MGVALILCAHLLGRGDPLGRHHGWAAADPPLAPGVLQPKARVLSDRVDAELREDNDDAIKRLPHRCSGVDGGLRETHDVQAAVVQLGQHLDHQTLTAGKSIELADLDRVAGARSYVDELAPLGAIGDAARFAVVDEHTTAAGRAQLGFLRARILGSGEESPGNSR